MKYYKYGHEKWIREDKGEEILKAMVDWRLSQMMGFSMIQPKYILLRERFYGVSKVERLIINQLGE